MQSWIIALLMIHNAHGQSTNFIITPRDTLLLEVQEVDNALIITRVKEIKDTSKTVLIMMKHESKIVKGETHWVTVLTLASSFSKPLTYKAKIRSLGANILEDTNVRPICPRIFAREKWNWIVLSITLSDWKITNQQAVCNF
jgi:hypothetical protein